MKKPKTPIYNPEDLKALPLGACPYCGGKATVTLDQQKEYTSLRDYYPAGFFIYGCNVKCENGCDLAHFYIPCDGDECLLLNEALDAYRKDWKHMCDMVKNPSPCGTCGVKPMWTVTSDSARIECPKCGRSFHDDYKYYHLGDLILKWEKDQRERSKVKEAETRLNNWALSE